MSSSTRPDPPAGSVGPAWTAFSAEEISTEPLPAERYEEGGELGRGGMGVVAVAHDTWLNREVARKRPRPDLPDATRQRLVREARITARLQHPGVVPVLDFGQDEDGAYYTMPVVDGASLETLLRGPLPQVVRILAGVARVMAYAHARGIVHRDLKPDNILVGSFGEIRVLDWGVALDPSDPDEHVVGTPGFMAPEQLAGERCGPTADVFALGCVLQRARLEEAPDLEAVCRRAMAVDRADRYPEAGVFADELDRWLEGRRVQAHDYSAGELLWRFLRAWRGSLMLGLLAGVLVLAALTGWATTNGWERDRALAAEHASQQARAEADANLAAALRQSAAAYLAVDADPHADTLANRSLALVDTPQARGIRMGSFGIPALEAVQQRTLPCEPVALSTVLTVCSTPTGLEVHGPDGIWKVPVQDPVRFVLADASAVLFVDALNHMEAWNRDGRLSDFSYAGTELREPAHGPGVAVRRRAQVGFLSGAQLIWSPEICTRILDAWTDGVRWAAVCEDRQVVWGDYTQVEEGHTLTAPLSSVTVVGEQVVVGTSDAQLLIYDGVWHAASSGVGPVRSLRTWPGGAVVSGEALTPVLWDTVTGVQRARLPRGGTVLSGGGMLEGDRVVDWRVPDSSRPRRLVRGGSDGVTSIALGAGDQLFAGNSEGALVAWNLVDGGVRRLARGCGNVTKDVAVVGEFVVAAQLGCLPRPTVLRLPDLTPSSDFESIAPRFLDVWDGRLVAGSYGEHLSIQGLGEERRLLEGFPLSTASQDPDELWILYRDGGVASHRGPGEPVERRFRTVGATHLARVSTGLLLLEENALVHRSVSGEETWRWTGPGLLTALTTSSEWTVVGDVDGRVFVIDSEGGLVASVRGHRRRVSDLVVEGDVAYSASWDGTVRRWGLAAARVDLETLFAADALAEDSLEAILAIPLP